LLSRNKYLNAFPFNCISDESNRAAVANALGQMDQRVLKRALRLSSSIPGAVARVIGTSAREAGVDVEDDLDLLRSGWERWLQAERLFGIQPYRNPYNLTSGLAYLPTPASIRSDAGRQLLARLVRLLRDPAGRQSDVTQLLATTIASSDPAVSSDAARLDKWAERVRHIAIALQHEATYSHHLTDADPEIDQFEAMAAQVKARNSVEMMEDVIARLAVLPDAKWQEFNLHARDDLESWWTNGAINSRNRALDHLSRLLEPKVAPDGRPNRAAAAVEIFSQFAMPAAGAAMGVSLGVLTGLPTAEAAGIGAGAGQVLGAVLTRGQNLGARRRLRRRLHRYFPTK
jgi:hypothetical protein